MLIQEPVHAAIWHCLNHYAYPDAIFLAERLRAEVESEDTLFLLATCYYRSGKPAEAYSILQQKGPTSPQCRYLLAKCCLDLQKVSEAEAALMGGDITRYRNFDDIILEFGDSAGFALALVARVFYASEKNAKGAEAYRQALRVNPFLWNSFEELCQKGEKPDPIKTFTYSYADSYSTIVGSNTGINHPDIYSEPTDHTYVTSTPSPVQNILNSTTNIVSGVRMFTPDDCNIPLCNMPLMSYRTKPNPQLYRNIWGGNISPLTPSFGVVPLDSTSSSGDGFLSPASAPLPPTTLTEANDQKGLVKRVSMSSHLSLRAHPLLNRKESPLQQAKPVFSQSGNTSHCVNSLTSPSNVPSPPTGPLHSAQNVRRSSRLFSNSYSVKENNKSPNRNKFVTPKSPSRKVKSRISKANLNKQSYNELNERNRVGSERAETITVLGEGSAVQVSYQSFSHQAALLHQQSIDGLLLLLGKVGTAYVHLTQFNCQKAIECLNELSQRQHNTGWVLCTLAKAYFELTDYKQAAKIFSRVRQLEPYRTHMMEIYSTALWHLQRESQLSDLAQDLVTFDRNSPVAWCAAGNCFSLQKEHDTAIKFFNRAVQVDPNFVYAYTLLGHEYVVTEELEKAMSCFRNAIRIHPRHYNAWYGIGTIYSKQERFKFAELHFKMALQINPHSSILMCHIAVVQNALQKTEQALQTLNAALEKDPQNPQCKFHRASIYFAAGRHAEALNELEQLKTIVPKESLVYYLTGKVHKKLGNTHLALMHFSWATDLDPKGASSQIKEAIDPAISRSHTEEAVDEFVSESTSTQDASSQELPVLMQDHDELL